MGESWLKFRRQKENHSPFEYFQVRTKFLLEQEGEENDQNMHGR